MPRKPAEPPLVALRCWNCQRDFHCRGPRIYQTHLGGPMRDDGTLLRQTLMLRMGGAETSVFVPT